MRSLLFCSSTQTGLTRLHRSRCRYGFTVLICFITMLVFYRTHALLSTTEKPFESSPSALEFLAIIRVSSFAFIHASSSLSSYRVPACTSSARSSRPLGPRPRTMNGQFSKDDDLLSLLLIDNLLFSSYVASPRLLRPARRLARRRVYSFDFMLMGHAGQDESLYKEDESKVQNEEATDQGGSRDSRRGESGPRVAVKWVLTSGSQFKEDGDMEEAAYKLERCAGLAHPSRRVFSELDAQAAGLLQQHASQAG